MKRGNTEWRYRFLRVNSANSLWHRNLKEISHASPFSILRRKIVSTVSRLFRENRVNARRKLNATLKADRRDRVNPSWIWISKGLPSWMKTWMTAGGPFGPGGVYTGSSGSFQKTGSPVISSVVHVGLVLRSQHPFGHGGPAKKRVSWGKRVAGNSRRGGPFKWNSFENSLVQPDKKISRATEHGESLTVFETMTREIRRGTTCLSREESVEFAFEF